MSVEYFFFSPVKGTQSHTSHSRYAQENSALEHLHTLFPQASLLPSNHSITQSISYEENSSNSTYIDLHREGKLHSRTASCKVSQILQMTTNIDNMAIFCVLSLPTVVMYSLTRTNPLSAATNHYGCQIHRQLKCAQTRRKVFHSNQE